MGGPLLADLAHYYARRDQLISAMDPRCYTIDWLDAQVLTGKLRLWVNDDAVLITELRQYPAGAREVHGMIAAGSLDGISRARSAVEAWARGAGVEFVTAASRPGWAKILKRHGYGLHQVEMRKEVL